MASNKTKRNIYLVLTIAATAGLVAILITKLCGVQISMWFYGFDMGVLLVSCLGYKNFSQAVKEDEKYGKNTPANDRSTIKSQRNKQTKIQHRLLPMISCSLCDIMKCIRKAGASIQIKQTA